MRILIFLLALSGSAMAQPAFIADVIGAAGWTSAGGGLTVFHSVGEPFIATLQPGAAGMVICEGFLQPETVVGVGLTPDDWQAADFRVYPNPASTAFSVAGDFSGQEQLLLYDLHGKVLMQRAVRADEAISVAELTAGSYALRILDPLRRRAFQATMIKR